MEKIGDMSLGHFIKILLKRKWILLLVTMTAFLVILIIITITLPVYRSTTSVLVSRSGTQQSILSGLRINPVFGGPDELETHIEILKSNSIALKVAEKLPADIFKKALAENVKKKEESLKWPFNIFFKFFVKKDSIIDTSNTISTQDNENEFPSPDNIKQVTDFTRISSVKDTNIIEISYESVDPELASEIANTITNVFIEESLIINRSSASEAKKFIEEQLLQKEKELAQLEEELQSITALGNTPDRVFQMDRLERTINVSENVYLILLEKYQEARISEVMDFTDIRIIDKASIPNKPIKPRKLSNLIGGGLLGLMLGVMLIFFLEETDNTIKSAEDVEHILNLPVLGTIPKDFSYLKKRKELKESI